MVARYKYLLLSAEAELWETVIVQVALLLFPGVSVDECEAFTVVFGAIPECTVVGVGATVGPVAGPGGVLDVDARFDEVRSPDIVVVPGGLGCARTAADGDVLGWLRTVVPRCQWMVASSTGTVVVAAAGLLDDQEAATHWLAAPMLESHGARASTRRVVERGRIITCAGQITAMHVALLVTLRAFGPETVTAVRRAIATSPAVVPGRRRRSRHRTSAAPTAPRRANPQLVAPDEIEFDEPVVTRRA